MLIGRRYKRASDECRSTIMGFVNMLPLANFEEKNSLEWNKAG